jgi:hypothetical protein
MNFEAVLMATANKLRVDFDSISKEINHKGSKGRVRKQS